MYGYWVTVAARKFRQRNSGMDIIQICHCKSALEVVGWFRFGSRPSSLKHMRRPVVTYIVVTFTMLSVSRNDYRMMNWNDLEGRDRGSIMIHYGSFLDRFTEKTSTTPTWVRISCFPDETWTENLPNTTENLPNTSLGQPARWLLVNKIGIFYILYAYVILTALVELRSEILNKLYFWKEQE
jgi:hypothetical protein